MVANALEIRAERELAETFRAAQSVPPVSVPQFRAIGDLVANIRPVPWLIKTHLEQGTSACLFGEPESGKSLLALDWGLHIASGMEWQGHRVTQGAVFVLCGEGAEGLRRRAKAWAIRHGVELDALPLYAHTVATDISDPTAAFAVGNAIQVIAEASGQQPRLIIVDTLSRHLAGDENSTADMARFVAHLDAHVREPTGACVLLVHHVGHGDKSRARGSTVLRGAVDTEFRMTRDPESRTVKLECSKAKDWQHPESTHYCIRVVELGIADEDGEPVTSAVLDATAAPEPTHEPRGRNQAKALATLRTLTADARRRLEGAGYNPDGARVTEKEWQDATGIDRRRWPEVRERLVAMDAVLIADGYACPK